MSLPHTNISFDHLNLNKQVNNVFCNQYLFKEDILYCRISLLGLKCIVVEFHDSNLSNNKVPKKLKVVFKASNVDDMIFLIKSHLYISSRLSVGHALYIGCELAKAQMALITAQNYVQN